MDDDKLVESALRDGPQAFSAIVERYQDAVFGIALSRVKNFHDAQDVAQSVFVEAFERLANLRDPSRLGPWLRTMTIGRSIDLLRRRRTASEMPQDAIDHRAETEANRRELHESVMAAIDKLTKPQRETVVLFYINGYSVDEVAAICEVSPGTIKSRLHDARAKLKEEMMNMVENVLKSESPEEEFGQRIFKLLSGPHRWEQAVEESRQSGVKGLDGFRRAYASPNWRTRRAAMHFILCAQEMRKQESVIELLKKALADTNKKVRRSAGASLLNMHVDENRKRTEFVPLVIKLLADPSKRVRRMTAFNLLPFASDVPIELAASALAREPEGFKAWGLRALVSKVLESRGGTN